MERTFTATIQITISANDLTEAYDRIADMMTEFAPPHVRTWDYERIPTETASDDELR